VTLARQFWAERLGQGADDSIEREVSAMLSVPFVDYARGDGVRVGPGEAESWTAVLLTDETGWVDRYRGLWGLDTRDPFGGERAPSGPKYNRDGTVRSSWYDPLGWAGLDKVSPPGDRSRDLERAVQNLESERTTLQDQIDEKRQQLRWLALEAATADDLRVSTAEAELHELAHQASQIDERLSATRAKLDQPDNVESDPQAHVRRKHRPEPPLTERARVVEFWSAISAGGPIASVGVLIVLAPAGWPLWVLLALGVTLVIEAATQHRLVHLLLNATIALAIITLLVLVKEFWQVVLVAALLGFLLMLVLQNLSELRRT
jgi:hypothetical protein